MNTTDFLEQMRVRAEAKANQLAALEKAIWNDSHEASLKNDFGFTDAEVTARKEDLTRKAGKAEFTGTLGKRIQNIINRHGA